ncbi:Polyphosphate kinase 2 (PPK2) [Phycisphaerae bacterium RAS1]|nr:Polyphosphate kinase 2 (PPK2) [Phycisphaerae bacterium RAS1]
MKIDPDDFRVGDGQEVDLDKWPTKVKPFYESREEYEALLADAVAQLSKLQDVLYASNRYALLVIFQAMDAAGKDSAIRHVFSGVNPQGFQVFGFKQPSNEELEHDFLWRTTRCLPERGRIGVFNRSYYEEVLIVRVHPKILDGQNLPPDAAGPPAIWKERCRSIVDMERHLHRNGMRIVKFFLHVSKQEQCKRLLARIDDPEKNWKFCPADIEERELWKEYMKAYEACLGATSTPGAPWYVVPADDKRNARLIISRVLRETLEDLKLKYPEVSDEQRSALRNVRQRLAN